MKDIVNKINESVNVKIPCAFVGLNDEEGLPLSCTILVDHKYYREISKFAKKEQDNIFVHFDNGDTVCY